MEEKIPKSNAGLLLVDDEPEALTEAAVYLKRKGYTVHTRQSAQAALEFLASTPVEVVVSDIKMPGMTGLEMLKEIKKTHDYTEVVLLTGYLDIDLIQTALRLDSADYLLKPTDMPSLILAIERAQKKVLLKKELALKIQRLQEEKEKTQELLNKFHTNLDLAEKIQRSLLPPILPKEDGINVHILFQPHEKIGGDFYDIHTLPDGSFGLLLADVAGHGISAALVSSMLKLAFSLEKEHIFSPSLMLQKINEDCIDITGDLLVSASFLFYDAPNRILKYAAGGLPPMLLAQKNTGDLSKETWSKVNPQGSILGLEKKIAFEIIETPVQKSTRLLLYTDGVIEERDGQGKHYGIQRLMQKCHEFLHLNAKDFLTKLEADISAWSQNAANNSYMDDVTIICIDFQF